MSWRPVHPDRHSHVRLRGWGGYLPVPDLREQRHTLTLMLHDLPSTLYTTLPRTVELRPLILEALDRVRIFSTKLLQISGDSEHNFPEQSVEQEEWRPSAPGGRTAHKVLWSRFLSGAQFGQECLQRNHFEPERILQTIWPIVLSVFDGVERPHRVEKNEQGDRGATPVVPSDNLIHTMELFLQRSPWVSIQGTCYRTPQHCQHEADGTFCTFKYAASPTQSPVG